MILSNTASALLVLTRLGIGHHVYGIPDSIDWPNVHALAEKQGLSAIVVDGINEIPGSYRPPKDLLLQWIGETINDYEYRFDLYRKTLSELAAFYNSHGFKMMVLKGYACSLSWPKPEHRPCGDIDIWLFGDYKEADAILRKEKGIVIHNDKQHHTMYNWQGFSVENHFDFTDLHHHKSNADIEKMLKGLGNKATDTIDLYGEKVYVPSPNMHALFLLKHAMSHFAAEGMTLRQILDWGFYVKEHTKAIDWPWLESILDKYGMKPAYHIFNAICVDDLGFSIDIFPSVQFNPFLKEKVLSDIVTPEFSGPLPRNFFARIYYKILRWRGNTWKHELCYKDSLWSAFWSGVYNHLRKPSTI